MSSGIEAKAAFKKAATWSSPVQAGQGDVILFLSESIKRSCQVLSDDSAGQAFSAAADQGLVTVGGDLKAYMRFAGLETLLAMALGTAGAPSLEGTGSYRHQLRLADQIDGLFGTLAIFKGFSVHEVASIKVEGFTLEGQAGQPLSLSLHLIGDDLAINTDSGSNTVASMQALNPPAAGNRVLMSQASFWINDASAGALSSGDAVQPSSFRLTFKRKLEGDHLAGGNDRIAEPFSAGFPEAGLELGFPSYTSDTFLSDLGSDARKKMRIHFIGQEIEDGHNYELTIQMPHLVLTNAEAAVDRAGKIAHPISAMLLGAETAPTGMEGITAPLAIDLKNTNDSDPLA